MSWTAPGTGAGPFTFVFAGLDSDEPSAAVESVVDGTRVAVAPADAVAGAADGVMATETLVGADDGGGSATGLIVTRLLDRVSLGCCRAALGDMAAVTGRGLARLRCRQLSHDREPDSLREQYMNNG